jgi:hypothetical protein
VNDPAQRKLGSVALGVEKKSSDQGDYLKLPAACIDYFSCL